MDGAFGGSGVVVSDLLQPDKIIAPNTKANNAINDNFCFIVLVSLAKSG